MRQDLSFIPSVGNGMRKLERYKTERETWMCRREQEYSLPDFPHVSAVHELSGCGASLRESGKSSSCHGLVLSSFGSSGACESDFKGFVFIHLLPFEMVYFTTKKAYWVGQENSTLVRIHLFPTGQVSICGAPYMHNNCPGKAITCM